MFTPDHVVIPSGAIEKRAHAFHPCTGKPDPAIEAMVRCATKRSGRSRLGPPKTETRSAALPACSDGIDNVGSGPECGVYIQVRRIEQVRIRGWFEGGRRAFRIALVAPTDIGQHVGKGH